MRAFYKCVFTEDRCTTLSKTSWKLMPMSVKANYHPSFCSKCIEHEKINFQTIVVHAKNRKKKPAIVYLSKGASYWFLTSGQGACFLFSLVQEICVSNNECIRQIWMCFAFVEAKFLALTLFETIFALYF